MVDNMMQYPENNANTQHIYLQMALVRSSWGLRGDARRHVLAVWFAVSFRPPRRRWSPKPHEEVQSSIRYVCMLPLRWLSHQDARAWAMLW